MKPTIRQLINDLPEPFRRKALANETYKISHWDAPYIGNKRHILDHAFYWHKSNEGELYWILVSKDLISGKIQFKPLTRKIIERALSLGLGCEIIYKSHLSDKLIMNIDDINYEDIKMIKFKKINYEKNTV